MPNILKKLNSFTAMRVKYGSYAVIASASAYTGPLTVDYLVIAGGGGGINGGAGAGGYRESSLSSTGGVDYSVKVGAGAPNAQKGVSSIFSSITSTGGGKGGQDGSLGGDMIGGSGGGGGNDPGYVGATGNQGGFSPVEVIDEKIELTPFCALAAPAPTLTE